MSVQTATLKMLEAVNAIVDKARKIHDGIPETVVVLGASGATRSGQKHGHYAPRSWGVRKAGEGDAAESDSGSGNNQREVYGEIFLAGESLERGAVGTLGTVLHELVHAYCYANEIQDTSNGNRYHNAKFRDKAEEFGLSIDKADTIGWSVTTVPQSTQETYAAELQALEDAIFVHRLGYSELQALTGEPEKAKPKVRKMQCLECQDPLLVTKKWFEANGDNLYCSLHDSRYEMYEE